MGVDGRPDRESLYRRLDVPPGASRADIARAYRRLAHGVHPDAHPDDPDAARRFQEITEAYEVLGDPERLAGHDATVVRVKTGRGADAGVPPPGMHPAARDRACHPGMTGSPVVLGLPPRSVAPVPLRAGPVRVESGPRPGPAFYRGWEDAVLADMARLLGGLFGSWWD